MTGTAITDMFFSNTLPLPAQVLNRPLALSIGHFDGVHLGHQQMIAQLVARANEMALTPAVMTFSPHAQLFFQQQTNFLLSSDADKAALLQRLGVQALFLLPFNQAFSALSADAFIDLLQETGSLRYLLVGDDFRFGHKGQGDFTLLKQRLEAAGCVVENTPSILYENRRISSSWVRELLRAKALDAANQLLGRAFSFAGEVVKGQQLGRKLGFATANLKIDEQMLLPEGVFLFKVYIFDPSQYSNQDNFHPSQYLNQDNFHPSHYDKQTLKQDLTAYFAMGNIGSRPTVLGTQRHVELHLFDFSGDLYGKTLRVIPCAHLRDEQRFSDINALQQQLVKDKAAALSLLDNYLNSKSH